MNDQNMIPEEFLRLLTYIHFIVCYQYIPSCEPHLQEFQTLFLLKLHYFRYNLYILIKKVRFFQAENLLDYNDRCHYHHRNCAVYPYEQLSFGKNLR